jgi:hypothetical protein
MYIYSIKKYKEPGGRSTYKIHAHRQKCIHKNKNGGCMEFIFHSEIMLLETILTTCTNPQLSDLRTVYLLANQCGNFAALS